MPIVALLALALLPQGQSLREQINVPLDTRNGYFEYMAAADVVRRAKVSWYISAAASPQWATELVEGSRARKSGDDEPDEPAIVEFARHVHKMTPLQIRKEAMTVAKDVFPLLETARKKGIWDPRTKVDTETFFPEFAGFRDVVKFLSVIACEVHFAEGNFHAATQDLLDSFRIADACATSPTLIGALVYRANQAIALRALEKHLVRFSLPDCLAIDQYAKVALTQPDMFARSIRAEAETVNGFVDTVFSGKATESLDYLDSDFLNEISKLGATQRLGYAEQTKSILRKRYGELIEILSKDERTMAKFLNDKKADEGDETTDAQKPIPERAADQFAFVDSQIVQVALLQKVQMRLLRAAMAILQFRWQNDRLPTRLTDAGEAAIVNDAITGQPFTYRNRGQSFELTGKGSQSMGEIKLYYRRPAPGGNEPPPPN